MSYLGTMDGWHGDEIECYGNCGICKNCDEKYYQSCDEDYENWRYEECC